MSSTVALRPMTPAQLPAYRQRAKADLAHNIAESGIMPAEQARRKAEATVDALLTQGLDTPNHHMLVAYDGDLEVGFLWYTMREESTGPYAYAWDFSVLEDFRGRGYGRAIIEAAVEVGRKLGVTSVGANVFVSNARARQLYEKYGFKTTAMQMQLRL